MDNSTEITLSENSTKEENLLLDIINSFNSTEPILPEPALTIIIAAYSILTTVAVMGNSTVILAVLLRRNMRTTRNIFILLLAISDLLSAFSIPLTLTDALSPLWIMGQYSINCKLVKTLPCIAVFMSSFTIMSVAMDRYLVICKPSLPQISFCMACGMGPLILLLAALSTCILFIRTKLYTLQEFLEKQGIIAEEYQDFLRSKFICIEDWNEDGPLSKEDRLNYTIFSVFVQFLLPLIVIVIVYSKIYSYLKNQPVVVNLQRARTRRTSTIFFLISLIFCLSWLPFCFFCIVSETTTLFENTEVMMISYCVCHMVGMSSSCTNPVLYAFFNTNFRREFRNIFNTCQQKFEARQRLDFSCQGRSNVKLVPVSHSPIRTTRRENMVLETHF